MQLASSSTQQLRQYMTSQQHVGNVFRAGVERQRPTSFLNAENVLGSFTFGCPPEHNEVFAPRFSTAKVPNPQTGVSETWLGVQFKSKLDGSGIETHGRPAMSIVLVCDISGSMMCPLQGDDVTCGSPPSKLDVAKRCVGAILDQLDARDSVGLILFNHSAQVLQRPVVCTPKAKAELRRKLDAVRPGGGTVLQDGFRAGMAALSSAMDAKRPLNRMYFLTDMESGPADEAAVLDHALTQANVSNLHTTVVGVGVDLSVGSVEKLSATPGGKYVSVMQSAEFQRAVGDDFAHDCVPIAFDIKLRLGGGYAIERAVGSAELNSLPPGATELTISSEFASPLNERGETTGGILILKLRSPVEFSASARPPTRATRVSRTSQGELLEVVCGWKSLDARTHELKTVVSIVSEDVPPTHASLRKAIALTRFVDLQSAFCEASSNIGLPARLNRLDEYRRERTELLVEMEAVGDDTLHGPNASFLETLDQIIELETRETDYLRTAAEERARAREAIAVLDAPQAATTSRGSKRRASAAAAETSATAPVAPIRASKRGKRGEPPAELLCPILKTLMKDPCCTCEGHTYERVAIEEWLSTHDTSPLTGLRLPSKVITPNYALRSMVLQWGGA